MTNTASYLHLRLKPAELAQVFRAAILRGMSSADFARDAVLREADTVIAAELVVTLSAEESRRFLKVMDVEFEPNAKLKKALARIARA